MGNKRKLEVISLSLEGFKPTDSFFRGVNHEQKSRTPMSEIQIEIRKSFGNPTDPSST